VLAEARAAEYADELAGAELLGTVPGAALLGRSYVPLFGYFAEAPNAFRVLSAEFVTTEDGTGIGIWHRDSARTTSEYARRPG